MFNLNWSKKLNKTQLGDFSETYAMMQFASNGWYVYPAMVDDHGVDFVAKYDNTFYEVQVKSIRGNTTVGIQEDKITLQDNFLICYIRYSDSDDIEPEVYIFPATVWNNPSGPFTIRQYKIKEFGINYSKKNLPILKQHSANNFFESFI